MESDIEHYIYSSGILNLLISISLGVLLGIIIFNWYLFPPLVKGPNSKDIVDKIFFVDGKYYELEPIICGCLQNINNN